MDLSSDYKAIGLLRKYIGDTNGDERVTVSLSMPLKLAVKRYDGTYRTKLVGDDIEMIVHDAYFSKKEDLICVFSIVNETVPADLEEVKFIEIPMKVLGDRLKSADFKKLMAQIGDVTDGEVSVSDAYSVPADAEIYDIIEEFGSWS